MQNSVIVMDDVSIHKSAELEAMVLARQVISLLTLLIKYLPNYLPEACAFFISHHIHPTSTQSKKPSQPSNPGYTQTMTMHVVNCQARSATHIK